MTNEWQAPNVNLPFRRREFLRLTGVLVFGALSVGVLNGCGGQAAAPGQSSKPATSASSGGTAASAAVSAAKPAAKTLSKADIANYQGSDREQVLLDGAKKEGKLMWYTSLIVDQVVQPLKEAFEAKYPGVKLEFYRGDDLDVVRRVANEYRVNRHDVDMIETPLPSLFEIQKVNALQPFWFPDAPKYAKGLVDTSRYWASDRIVYYILTWNTSLIKPSDAPNTYEDLLKPEFKGKMASNSIYTGGPQWIGGILQTMREDKGRKFLDGLAAQNVKIFNMTPAALMDLIVSGEVAMSPTTFNHHAEIRVAKGAPIAWKELHPSFAYTGGVAVAADPPHPYAAMLFIDYLMGEEGQRELVKLKYIPTHPNVPPDPPGLRLPDAWTFDPAIETQKRDQWINLFRQLFMGGKN